MSFHIERSHVIFKHLIHVGPEINPEAISEIAIKNDYNKSTRQITTPVGPLTEYLFRQKTNPQSLIVFSQKGFVIDAQPLDAVLPLFRDAYDFYEKVMGDQTMTITAVMEINATFEIYSPIPVKIIIGNVFNNDSNKFKFADKALTPFGFTLSAGSGKFPEESIQITVQPFMKDPDRRLVIIAIYRSTELDEALKFIEKLEENIIESLNIISKSANK